MKLVKIFLYTLLVMLILSLGIPVLLMILVNPNQFKPQIQKQVQKAIHRPFVINGNLYWRVFPSAGITGEGITVGDSLLYIKSMEFDLALKPLLNKDIQIGKIIIDGMKLDLIKKANGKANWDAADSTLPSQDKPDKTASTASKAAVFSVSELMIKNSQISYTDQAKNKYVKLSNYNLKATQINTTSAFPVVMSTVVTSDSLAGSSTIHASAKFNFSPEQNRLKITNINATVNDDFVLTGNKTVEFTGPIRWQANINLTNIKIDHLLKLFKNNKLDVSGVGNISGNLSGSMSVNTLNGNIKFELQNGIFHGVDLYYYSNVADSIVNKTPPSLTDTHQTPFGDLTGTAKIQNGILNNNDLLIKADKVYAYGNGSANLNNQQLDYQLSLQRMTSGAEIKPRGPAVPLIISGNFANPDIKLNVQSLLVSEVKQQIQDKVQEYAPQVNKKIAEGLQSLLGG